VFGSILDEWPIKVVSVESREDEWLRITNMVEKPNEQLLFIGFVEDFEEADVIFWLRTVLEILNIFPDHLSVCDEEAFSIDNIRNHHNLIELGVGELQGRLRSFNIERHDPKVRFVELLW